MICCVLSILVFNKVSKLAYKNYECANPNSALIFTHKMVMRQTAANHLQLAMLNELSTTQTVHLC